MSKYKIRIDKINIENNIFSIKSHNNTVFNSNITRGSVEFKIYTESGKEVNLSNINEGDLVTVYGNLEEKNNIINIKKIKIKDMYILMSDSSEDF
jgi:tRNA(Ile2) C34 agmatinyltransferase TiaS